MKKKTDFFFFFCCRYSKTKHFLTPLCYHWNTTIDPSSTVRNLGVEFDSAINMSSHVSPYCKTVDFHLCNLSRIKCTWKISYAITASVHQLLHAPIMQINFYRAHLAKNLSAFNDYKTELLN